MSEMASIQNFRMLSERRLREARILLNAGEWDGAYYLAGYSVEFALKAKIISMLMATNSFPSKKNVEAFYRHDLTSLRKLADLELDMNSNEEVNNAWLVVKDWSEQSRYQTGKSENQSRELLDYIEEKVLPWIMNQ
jgi:HEPN domain-containing protein